MLLVEKRKYIMAKCHNCQSDDLELEKAPVCGFDLNNWAETKYHYTCNSCNHSGTIYITNGNN